MTFRWTIRLFSLLILGAVVVNACNKKDAGKTGPTPLTFTIPAGFPQPVYTFADNPLTEEGFQLGRKLFYDGRLSKDGNFPCSSCHQQFAAFANFDHDLSHGFNNQFTKRNSPGLFNMVWQKELMWDGGINHLEVQPLAPLTAPNEMAEDVNAIIQKLKADTLYPKLFEAAFGSRDITSQKLLFALTQFVGSLVSANSKYDKMKRGEVSFTDPENQGYLIFQAKCASCHVEPLFTDLSYRNTGMPFRIGLNDIGRMRITNSPADSMKFKVPSLRNVIPTFPYGHDGRFYTVKNVMDHYSDGVVDGPTVDPLMKNKIPLTIIDKFYLTQFLYTLTDSAFLKNPRFAEPK